MRVEPEQMLEEDRIAAELWVEKAEMPEPFQGHQSESDGEDRRGEDQDDAGGIEGPEE